VPFLLLLLLGLGLAVWRLALAAAAQRPLPVIGWVLALLVGFVCLFGHFMVEPNKARVLTLFGAYRGTERRAGLRFANPFYAKKSISLRVRNFETGHLKVNDHDGNPIEIAAVVVWKVVDSYEAVFHVDDYENFVHVQSEAA